MKKAAAKTLLVVLAALSLWPGAMGGIDLVPWIDAPHQASAGQTLSRVRVTLFNLGCFPAPGLENAANGYALEVVLTTNPHQISETAIHIDVWSDALAADHGRITQTPNINPGQMATWSDLNVRLPQDLAAGHYYLGVIADPMRVLEDTDWSNNTHWHMLVVELNDLQRDPRPDLVPWVNCPPTVERDHFVGAPVDIAIFNTGSARASAISAKKDGFSVQVILSSDMSAPMGPATASKVWREDMLVKGGHFVQKDPIKAGDVVRFHISKLALPEDLKPGLYYLGVLVDPEGLTRDIERDNNIAWMEIQVGKQMAHEPNDG